MIRPKFKDYLKERLNDKLFTAVVLIFFAYLMFSVVYFSINFNLRNILLSIVYNIAIVLIVVVEYFMGVRLGALFTACALFVAFGGHGGPCYNIYSIIPFFDTLLHILSGVIFACMGFAVAEKFFGKITSKRKFLGYMFFGFCFSQMIAVFWECFEYMFTMVFDIEMMADETVYRINSFYLSNDYNNATIIENIEKTTIHYGNGQIYELNGYLDLGLIDTLTDLLVCTLGGVFFMAVTVFSYFKAPKINNLLLPKLVYEKPNLSEKMQELIKDRELKESA